MKLSPILLFLLILLALAISIIFGNWVQNEYATPATRYNTEGFMAYQAKVSTHGNIRIPYYSTKKSVHKLHDCLYYDYVNGSVIVLDGTQANASVPNDLSGSTITTVSMYDRNGETRGTTTYTPDKLPTDFESELSKINGLSTSYKCFTVIASVKSNIQPPTPDVGVAGTGAAAPATPPPAAPVTVEDKYELVYIPWGRETYLHLIELKSADTATGSTQVVRRHKYTFAYDNTGRIIETFDYENKSTRGNVAAYPVTTASSPFLLTNNILNSHITTHDGVYTIADKYNASRQLYQLCNNIKYDKTNGFIVSTVKDSNKIYIYKRAKINSTSRHIAPDIYDTSPNSNNPLTPTEVTNDLDVANGFNVGVFNSVSPDSENTSLYSILYFTIGKRTILLALKAIGSAESPEYDIHKVVRIDEMKQVDTGANYSGSNSGSSSSTSGNTAVPPSNTENDLQRFTYENAMRYWFTQNAGYDGTTINDYMLKTHVVPPVCPTCPSCPSVGVCTDCGGKGGSGTKKAASKEKEDEDDEKKSDKDTDNGRSLIRDTGSGATNLLRDTGSGATNLLRDTGSGATNLLRDTASGTVGLAKDTVGGAVDLAKDTVGGVVNTFGKLAPTRVSDINYPGYVSQSYYAPNTQLPGQYGNQPTISTNAGSDPISYFGALPAKGGDPIPVTADFSRFGR
jgi:hypothetical protein